jgi:hypothetical protein
VIIADYSRQQGGIFTRRLGITITDGEQRICALVGDVMNEGLDQPVSILSRLKAVIVSVFQQSCQFIDLGFYIQRNVLVTTF